MAWDVEHTDEFSEWFTALGEVEQDSIDFSVDLLIEQGPTRFTMCIVMN